MRLSAHQPAYLPWLGYLDRIRRADVFVFLDTVQFEKNSFTNRNRIKSQQGPLWLTVPVRSRGHLEGTLKDLAIDDSRDWRKKHLGSISASYSRAPEFRDLFPALEEQIRARHELLADLCHEQLLFWLARLGITTRVVRASSLEVRSAKSELILELCRILGATSYLSGPLGKDYLQEEDFARASVAVEYHHYETPPYPQLHGAFVPRLSVVDFLMNCKTPGRAWTT